MYRSRAQKTLLLVFALGLHQALAVVGVSSDPATFARIDPVVGEQCPGEFQFGMIGRADKLDLGLTERLPVMAPAIAAGRPVFEGRPEANWRAPSHPPRRQPAWADVAGGVRPAANLANFSTRASLRGRAASQVLVRDGVWLRVP